MSQAPRLVIATIFLALAGGPALAADLVPYPVPSNGSLPPPPVGTTWSGFYIGGNLGAAFDPNDLSIKDLSEEQDLSLRFSNDTELVGGVQAGYNWQLGNWVLGVEGDIDFADSISPRPVAVSGGQQVIGSSMALGALRSSTPTTTSPFPRLTKGSLA
jgi:outer membrane immunogenic protein